MNNLMFNLSIAWIVDFILCAIICLVIILAIKNKKGSKK